MKKLLTLILLVGLFSGCANELSLNEVSSLDYPDFVSVNDLGVELDPEALGVAVSSAGFERFYPFEVLNEYQVVNDLIASEFILVTYCRLCNSSVVYEPVVNGEVTEFEVTDQLWENNLLMRDRQKESLWSQSFGKAIDGEMTGVRLELSEYQNLTWSEWSSRYPNGQVVTAE